MKKANINSNQHAEGCIAYKRGAITSQDLAVKNEPMDVTMAAIPVV